MQNMRTRTGRIIAGGVLAAALTVGGTGLVVSQGHGEPFGGMPFGAGTAGPGASGAAAGYGPGMMGGAGYGPGGAAVAGASGYAPGGMMGGYGAGPAGYTGAPGSMMAGWFSSPPTGTAISLAQAQQDAQTYLSGLNNPDLRLDEIMEFQGNFYAIIKEHSTGTAAAEILINRSTGAVMREPGPDVLWNTKYGMLGTNAPMAQYMGTSPSTGPMTVSADQAKQIAQQWLAGNQPGSTTETPDQFYGYYTLHILKDGKVTGMLSVNGYTGQVWYHSWHGAFIQMKDLAQ